VADDGKNQTSTIATPDEALAGARDILAERISDDKDARAKLRALYQRDAVISSKVLPGKENDAEAAKFKDYFEWSEPLAKAPSHRVLAMRRGEKELFLMMRVQLPDDTAAFAAVQALFVKSKGPAADQVVLAVQDASKRLLAPAMETEMRLESKKRADEAAGDRPGLPHRLQDRAAGSPGQVAAQRRDLPRPPRGGVEGEAARVREVL
jgi:uncharacterized protein